MNAIFFIAAAVAIISSLLAISNKNAIHALLFLILSLLAISIIFYITGSPFIAALEVIVYAGAIMVLFIFVVMMLNVGSEKQQESRWLSPRIWVMPAILAVILFATFMYALSSMKPIQREVQVIGPKQVGVTLFTTYLIAVEISAIMLLAGIVGAYHLGRRKKSVVHRFLKKEEKRVLTNIPS
ncbi:MAG TPA: NADH-quinone oxidoreductase subunit J [Bacteroidales bacterium]|nr:NADH-quinone oxidoreductase subunit J [Bacteroidales bacterium]